MTDHLFQRPRSPLTRVREVREITEPTLTHQSFKEETDAEYIVNQYARTGVLPHPPRTEPRYGDNPDINLFEAACIQAEIRSAQEHEALYPGESSPEADSARQSDQNLSSEGDTPADDENGSQSDSEAVMGRDDESRAQSAIN